MKTKNWKERATLPVQHVVFEISVSSQVCTAALISQHQDTPNPTLPGPGKTNQRYKPSTPKHAKQICFIESWTWKKHAKARWTCRHTCDCGYTGGWVNAAFQTPLHCPVQLLLFSVAVSISKGYVCFATARVWTASLLTAQKLYVLMLTQKLRSQCRRDERSLMSEHLLWIKELTWPCGIIHTKQKSVHYSNFKSKDFQKYSFNRRLQLFHFFSNNHSSEFRNQWNSQQGQSA